MIGAAIYTSASVGWDWASSMSSESIDYGQVDYMAWAQSGDAQYAADTQTA